MTSQALDLQALTFTLLLVQSLGLNTDGVLLLTFKYSILSDPLGVLVNWNVRDQNPCLWQGVTCGEVATTTNSSLRVTMLSLPDSQLLGSISADLGMIPHLRDVRLSNNSINGSIPLSLLGASMLETLDLSNNLISGELSEFAGGLTSLKLLNLSDNAISGKIPRNLTALGNLTVLSLKSNYFSGNLPSGFNSLQVLDLSSNLINGSLPSNFTGNNLHYLNVSYNRISGEIPPEFADEIPADAVIDLSFNNLTGQIPETTLFSNQNKKSFEGNSKLCGKPLKGLCPIPSTISNPPNTDSPPAIAAIPKQPIDSSPNTNSSGSGQGRARKNRLRPATIVAIIVGDVVGVAIVAVIFLYVYQLKKKRSGDSSGTKMAVVAEERDYDWSSSSEEEPRRGIRACGCFRKKFTNDEETSDSTSSMDHENDDDVKASQVQPEKKNGALVTVDGEKELEIETLLKASAYILGATGSSIMYKAVLEDGTTMAVRRIGENGVERFRDFENQVRSIAKLVHPNLVRIRGFYWGTDEKLIIYDFVPNGSLANARYRKTGSSPCHIPWEVRLKIARGVARGLTYLHDKKHVHGNLKPSNILLGLDMEPKIGDFGLERLVTGESGYKPGASARNFGSKRSTASRESFQDNMIGSTPSPSPSSLGGISPYYAPESLRSIKPNTKWDVFSFGVVLLELLTGKVIYSDELGPGPGGLAGEEKNRVLRMADVAIRADLEGREEALLALLRLGFNCLSPAPQKRPQMKEALQALEKFPSSSTSTSSFY